MYGGKHIAQGDTIFIFASENEGGPGLVAAGIVTSAEATPKTRQPPSSAASSRNRRRHTMPTLDHFIMKVNDIDASVRFYTEILGFAAEGTDGPFTVIRVGPDSQIQLAPWGTPGFEHYAFGVSRAEFDRIFERIKAAGIAHGPTFDAVGTNTGPGEESGARGRAPTLYFNDPNKHLLEIRTYED